ncbi:hypothetical protein GCM10007940_45400 [Portibacter lacus]|uniref:WD40-like Beta Propeller Repeat n=2 Tax=Portibacter lacus TaxID=1099794 RepID=A0AA37SUF1_9BACT|nr:hypothetical protein GCM10007940_45400 [Portibacter lacus]
MACAQKTDERLKYLAQKPPSLEAEVFAPGHISRNQISEFGSVFNKDGTAFYYGIDIDGRTEIKYTELIKNKWSEPITILSHINYGFNDPFLSNDEQRLYFISQKALEDNTSKQDHDIWYVKKIGEKWSEPINAGTNINTKYNEYYMSFTEKGSMYFSSNKKSENENGQSFDIYYADILNGEFQEAIRLGESINTNSYEADVFVDPDEQYLIFCSIRPGGKGRGDLYISFKDTDGSWTEAITMGDKINTKNHELCPFVSKDGKYFFYTSNQDIYWISAEIIDELKQGR